MSDWIWFCFDCNREVIDYFDESIGHQWYKRWFHKIHNCLLVNKKTLLPTSNRIDMSRIMKTKVDAVC